MRYSNHMVYPISANKAAAEQNPAPPLCFPEQPPGVANCGGFSMDAWGIGGAKGEGYLDQNSRNV